MSISAATCGARLLSFRYFVCFDYALYGEAASSLLKFAYGLSDFAV